MDDYDRSAAGSELIGLASMPELPLGRMRRWFRATCAFAIVLSLIFLLLYLGSVLGWTQRLSQAGLQQHSAGARIESINRQMEALQGKFSVLLAESVERRMHELERAIAAGQVDAESVRAFEQLKHDFNVLQASGREVESLDSDRIEHERFRSQSAPANSADAGELLASVLELKGLLYVLLLFVSASTLAAGGYWLEYRRRLRRLPARPAPVALLPQAGVPPRD